MEFQVKGNEYFLLFAEDEKRWVLIAHTDEGVQRMPVYVDGPKQERRAAERKGTPKLS
jgi:hypothetical protein